MQVAHCRRSGVYKTEGVKHLLCWSLLPSLPACFYAVGVWEKFSCECTIICSVTIYKASVTLKKHTSELAELDASDMFQTLL